MDPTITELATGVLTFLSPYTVKGAEETTKLVAKDVYEKAKELYSTLKQRWKGDTGAESALVGYKEDPDSFKPALENILIKRLTEDKNLYAELSKYMNENRPIWTVIQETKNAENVVGVDAEKMGGEDVHVRQKAETAKDMIGIRIRRD